MKQQKFERELWTVEATTTKKKSTTAHRQWCDKSIKNINTYYHLSQPNPNQIKNHKNTPSVLYTHSHHPIFYIFIKKENNFFCAHSVLEVQFYTLMLSLYSFVSAILH